MSSIVYLTGPIRTPLDQHYVVVRIREGVQNPEVLACDETGRKLWNITPPGWTETHVVMEAMDRWRVLALELMSEMGMCPGDQDARLRKNGLLPEAVYEPGKAAI